jgi:hypothetical protein
LLNGDW